MSKYEGYTFGQPVKQRAAIYGSVGSGSPTQPLPQTQQSPQGAQSPRNYRNTIQISNPSAIYGNFGSSDPSNASQNASANTGVRLNNPMLAAKPVGFTPTSAVLPPQTASQPAPKSNIYDSFGSTSPPPPNSTPAPPQVHQRPLSMLPNANPPVSSTQTPQRIGMLPPMQPSVASSAAPVSLSTGVIRQAGPVVPKVPANVPVIARPPVIPKIPAQIPTVSLAPPNAPKVSTPVGIAPSNQKPTPAATPKAPAGTTVISQQRTPFQQQNTSLQPQQPKSLAIYESFGSVSPPPPSTLPPPPPPQTPVVPPPAQLHMASPSTPAFPHPIVETLEESPIATDLLLVSTLPVSNTPTTSQPSSAPMNVPAPTLPPQQPPSLPTPARLPFLKSGPAETQNYRRSWAPGTVVPASSTAQTKPVLPTPALPTSVLPVGSGSSAAPVRSPATATSEISGRSSSSLNAPSSSKPKLTKVPATLSIARQGSEITVAPSSKAIPTTGLKQSSSSNSVPQSDSQTTPALLAWSQIDWNNVSLTRQSIFDIRTAGQQEISKAQQAVEHWQKEAEHLRKELQTLRLQRLRDPSLLRPNFSSWLSSLEDKEKQAISKLQRQCRVNLVKMRWTRMVEQVKKTESAKLIRRRNDVCKEIVASERQYVEYLWNLISGYKKAFDSAIEEGVLAGALKTTPEKLKKWSSQLFVNAQDILNFNMTLLAAFQDEWKKWPSKPVSLADAITKLVPGMKIYSTYVNKYDQVTQVLAELMKKSAIRAIFDEVQKRPSVRNMPLEMYLIMPVQRVPRYELLLRELGKFTSEDHIEYEAVQRASQAVAELAKWINEEKRRWEGSEKLRLIVSSLKDCPADVVLNNPERKLMRKGKIGSGAKLRKFFLLTDMLIVGNSSDVCEAVIDLSVANVTEDPKAPAVSIWYVGPDQAVKSYHIGFDTAEQKQEFKGALLARIAVLAQAKLQ